MLGCSGDVRNWRVYTRTMIKTELSFSMCIVRSVDFDILIVSSNKNILCLYINACSFILIFLPFSTEIKGDFAWFYNSSAP